MLAVSSSYYNVNIRHSVVNVLNLRFEQLLVANDASDCMQNAKSFKKKSSRRLKVEFKDRANIFLNQKGKLYFYLIP